MAVRAPCRPFGREAVARAVSPYTQVPRLKLTQAASSSSVDTRGVRAEVQCIKCVSSTCRTAMTALSYTYFECPQTIKNIET